MQHDVVPSVQVSCSTAKGIVRRGYRACIYQVSCSTAPTLTLTPTLSNPNPNPNVGSLSGSSRGTGVVLGLGLGLGTVLGPVLVLVLGIVLELLQGSGGLRISHRFMLPRSSRNPNLTLPSSMTLTLTLVACSPIQQISWEPVLILTLTLTLAEPDSVPALILTLNLELVA